MGRLLRYKKTGQLPQGRGGRKKGGSIKEGRKWKPKCVFKKSDFQELTFQYGLIRSIEFGLGGLQLELWLFLRNDGNNPARFLFSPDRNHARILGFEHRYHWVWKRFFANVFSHIWRRCSKFYITTHGWTMRGQVASKSFLLLIWQLSLLIEHPTLDRTPDTSKKCSSRFRHNLPS